MPAHFSKLISVLLILVSGISWGIISLFVRSLCASGLSSLQIAAMRSFWAATSVGLYLLCRNRRAFAFHWRDLWCFAGIGIGSIAFFNACYFAAMQRLSVSLAVILLYTSPAIITILSMIFFKERLTLRKLIAILMVFIGVVLVSLSSGETIRIDAAGLLLGLGAGFGYSLFSIFGRCAQQRNYDSITITFWAFAFSAMALFIFEGPSAVASSFHLPARAWHILTGLVLISTILPYICYTAGLRGTELSTAAIIVAVEPVVATLTGTIAFHEPLGIRAVIGILFVLSSFFLLSPPRKNGPKIQHSDE